MFRVTTKKDYWHYLDSCAAKPNRGRLKDVQDAFILYVLREVENKRILELGGGNSRVLPLLAERNECWNIDKFEGLGGGPITAQKSRGIGQRHAQEQAEQPAGEGVADAASQGHGSKEPPHAEDQRAGLLIEPIADPAGVLGVVLTVGVEGDDPRGITVAGEADVHGRAQRGALAE
jgi:hypothetical protein